MKSELPLPEQLLPRDQPVPDIWGAHAETSLLDLIVFSKNRAAQLDALLRSLRAFFPLPHRLHVIYTTSTPAFESGYDRLRRWHRGVHWIDDEGTFGEVTRNLVREISHGPGRYLMFLVDDLLFTRPFTAMSLMESLDDDDQLLAVSLNLGGNVTRSYVRDRETSPPAFQQGFRWTWRKAGPGWNYPMGLDANIYRTADVSKLLSTLAFTSPNALEAAMAGHPFPHPCMVCEATSSVVNIAANRVQDVFPNRCGTQGADFLNEAFLAGQAIDVRHFTGRQFNSPHIDEELPLIADERNPEPAGFTRIQRDGRDYLRIDLREIPTFILNCADDRQKRMLMQEQMSELGMNHEFVRTLRVEPGWVGVALAHTKALRLSRARPPFLVLEDDCVFDEDFRPVIEVPAEADCLYLSASIFGIRKPGQMSWGQADGVFWERYDTGFLRVYNMLARHAVLYLNSDFQRAVIESGVEALTNRHLPYMCDIGAAMLQATHIALLTERSMCRQRIRGSSTGGRLAEKLPDNEWIGGKAIKITANPGAQNKESLSPDTRVASVRAPLATGLVSHQFGFIYFQIGKNASSTLRAELGKPRYACEPFASGTLDEEVLRKYFKFTFLRDPVSRLVSAYQEISFRHELRDSSVEARPFMNEGDDPGRFEAFLREVEKDKWDRYVFTQGAFLGGVVMDFYGRVESLATDLQTVFDKIGLGRCPCLPRRRSRSGRASDSGYNRFNIDHRQLPPEQISRIRALYQEDVELVLARCPVPPLFMPEDSRQAAGQGMEPPGGTAITQDQNAAPPPAYARYRGTLQLRGGARYTFDVPADSPWVGPLNGLVSGGQAPRPAGLFQLPLQDGHSALTFSGADVRFISLALDPLPPR